MVRQDSGSNFSLYPTAALSLLPILFLTLFHCLRLLGEQCFIRQQKRHTALGQRYRTPESRPPYSHRCSRAQNYHRPDGGAGCQRQQDPRAAPTGQPGISARWSAYTFYLRKDARWSNGDPHNAHDYVWSWWRALQPALGNLYAYMYFPIDNAREYYEGSITNFDQVGVKALDDHTLQVRLKNPTPILQLLDHYSLFPIHRPTIEKFGSPDERGTRWTYEGNLVGNGAFQLSEWKIKRRVWLNATPTTGMQTMSA